MGSGPQLRGVERVDADPRPSPWPARRGRGSLVRWEGRAFWAQVMSLSRAWKSRMALCVSVVIGCDFFSFVFDFISLGPFSVLLRGSS